MKHWCERVLLRTPRVLNTCWITVIKCLAEKRQGLFQLMIPEAFILLQQGRHGRVAQIIAGVCNRGCLHYSTAESREPGRNPGPGWNFQWAFFLQLDPTSKGVHKQHCQLRIKPSKGGLMWNISKTEQHLATCERARQEQLEGLP